MLQEKEAYFSNSRSRWGRVFEGLNVEATCGNHVCEAYDQSIF